MTPWVILGMGKIKDLGIELSIKVFELCLIQRPRNLSINKCCLSTYERTILHRTGHPFRGKKMFYLYSVSTMGIRNLGGIANRAESMDSPIFDISDSNFFLALMDMTCPLTFFLVLRDTSGDGLVELKGGKKEDEE